MSIVTVLGAHGQIVSLSFDTDANAALARKLAAALTAGLRNGSIAPAVDTDGPPPPLPPGATGEFVQTEDGLTDLPAGYKAFVDTASESVVFGSGDADQSVLSSVGDMTFNATGGSGTVVAGGGNNRIVIPGDDNGNWSINTGKGDDAILAMGGGSDTINPGGGSNAVSLGGGKYVMQSTGDDTVIAGSGAETIAAFGAAQRPDLRRCQPTVTTSAPRARSPYSAAVAATPFFGGAGPDVVHGGTGGSNFLVAGTGFATLFGGGNGDPLVASGKHRSGITCRGRQRDPQRSPAPARIRSSAAAARSRSSAVPTTPSWPAPGRPRSMHRSATTHSYLTTARRAAPR